jgi:hypothetical protein
VRWEIDNRKAEVDERFRFDVQMKLLEGKIVMHDKCSKPPRLKLGTPIDTPSRV